MHPSVSRRLPGRIRRLLERRTYLPGVEPVALDELASPLRYDLGVRRNPVTRFLFGLKPIGGPHAGGHEGP